MAATAGPYRPQMTRAGAEPVLPCEVLDEQGRPRALSIAAERPLTVFLDRREIVTLMTLGSEPEALAIGYLRNQGLVGRLEDLRAVQVDWEVGVAAVASNDGQAGAAARLDKRTVTSGCGQGTVYGELMDVINAIRLPPVRISRSRIYALLENLSRCNEIYRRAGAVHGCALCRGEEVLWFVEDVGRHNAVDIIAGKMWLAGMEGGDKVFFTTGRLTSEMVIKVAQIGVPVLLSRSGVTAMGVELAQRAGVVMIARARGRRFFTVTGRDAVILDEASACVP